MLLVVLAGLIRQGPMVMVIRPVVPGVHVISGYANGNILAVEGPDQVLLVDAQSGKRVGLADSALRTVTRKPVRQVAFTHYHEDHTQGMSHWRAQGAIAVAHQAVAPQMAKDTTIADWENWHRTPAAPEALPDRIFADSMVIPLGARRVVLVHVPGAHTNGDAMAWLPDDNVLHTGDLVEPGGPPFIDWWAGGSLDGMIAAADYILSRVNDQTRIVPGHGDVIGRSTVVEHRRMLVTVRDRLVAAAAAGKTLEQVQAERPAEEFESLLGGPRRAGHFIRVAWYGVPRTGEDRTGSGLRVIRWGGKALLVMDLDGPFPRGVGRLSHPPPTLCCKRVGGPMPRCRGRSAPSAAELRVLTELVRGRTLEGIATSCGISTSTVRYHLSRLKNRLGAKTQAELAAIAVSLGLAQVATREQVRRIGDQEQQAEP
jgi:glyoxylase-like metal-dependent hydrolase (beta-lactamase superfamily II)/DNA-binding CsgD family transcriptional regulator